MAPPAINSANATHFNNPNSTLPQQEARKKKKPPRKKRTENNVPLPPAAPSTNDLQSTQSPDVFSNQNRRMPLPSHNMVAPEIKPEQKAPPGSSQNSSMETVKDKKEIPEDLFDGWTDQSLNETFTISNTFPDIASNDTISNGTQQQKGKTSASSSNSSEAAAPSYNNSPTTTNDPTTLSTEVQPTAAQFAAAMEEDREINASSSDSSQVISTNGQHTQSTINNPTAQTANGPPTATPVAETIALAGITQNVVTQKYYSIKDIRPSAQKKIDENRKKIDKHISDLHNRILEKITEKGVELMEAIQVITDENPLKNTKNIYASELRIQIQIIINKKIDYLESQLQVLEDLEDMISSKATGGNYFEQAIRYIFPENQVDEIVGGLESLNAQKNQLALRTPLPPPRPIEISVEKFEEDSGISETEDETDAEIEETEDETDSEIEESEDAKPQIVTTSTYPNIASPDNTKLQTAKGSKDPTTPQPNLDTEIKASPSQTPDFTGEATDDKSSSKTKGLAKFKKIFRGEQNNQNSGK